MKKILSILIPVMILFSSYASAEDPLPELKAKSLILMEADTGQILYEKNPDERLPIASVTKVMTMLLTMEAIDSGKISENDTVTASERAKSMGGSTMFLEAGEQIGVHDILKGIAVASANDGAVAIAEHLAGSETAFVEEMNKRAAELQMENTHFVNTNGLDDDNHYSSARDVAIMSRELLRHPKIFEYTTIWMDTLRDGKFQLANTNKLIRFYRGANGLKTGSTSKALCCLSATAERDGMQLVAVVLGAPTSKDRFAAASGLLDYGFANYRTEKAVTAGESLESVPVEKGVKPSVSVAARKDSFILLSKKEGGEIEKKLSLPDAAAAPITAGSPAGTLELYLDGRLYETVELVYEEDVPKKSFVAFWGEILRKLISC